MNMNMGMEVEPVNMSQYIDEFRDSLQVAEVKLRNKDERINKLTNENIELKAQVEILMELIKDLKNG